jgi:glycosyltransferase involved in cell wall biosynthesis
VTPHTVPAPDASNGAPQIIDSPAWARLDREAAPKAELSVLIPFFRDDPQRLLAALDRETMGLGDRVEIIVLDDGGGDLNLSERTAAAVRGLNAPVRLIRLGVNEGRARGRNRLADAASARHVLFLDSDMLPDRPDFLRAYLQLIPTDPAVVVGGFSVAQCPYRAVHALHRAMAARADCQPAAVRSLAPEKYVFTSTLLVRRDVFDAEAFDEEFRGWGWEDVEWGARVSRRFPLLHIDNPATHLGLDTPADLASKYEQSVANFARLVARHPDLVCRYPSFRAARLFKKWPGVAYWRGMFKHLALSSLAPLTLRVAAMKLYRAALYVEAV